MVNKREGKRLNPIQVGLRADMAALEAQGIGRLFGPGTSTSDLVDFIKTWFAARQSQEA